MPKPLSLRNKVQSINQSISLSLVDLMAHTHGPVFGRLLTSSSVMSLFQSQHVRSAVIDKQNRLPLFSEAALEIQSYKASLMREPH